MGIEPIQNGIRVTVYVQPRASRTELSGWHGDAVKIRLAAPPVDNAANEELVGFLADLLGVPAGAVEIERGHTSRRKTVRVRGVTARQAESRLVPSR